MEIYEIEDLCEILKIGKSTAYDLVRKKEIEAFKIRGVWKIPKIAVEEYLKKQARLID